MHILQVDQIPQSYNIKQNTQDNIRDDCGPSNVFRRVNSYKHYYFTVPWVKPILKYKHGFKVYVSARLSGRMYF